MFGRGDVIGLMGISMEARGGLTISGDNKGTVDASEAAAFFTRVVFFFPLGAAEAAERPEASEVPGKTSSSTAFFLRGGIVND